MSDMLLIYQEMNRVSRIDNENDYMPVLLL